MAKTGNIMALSMLLLISTLSIAQDPISDYTALFGKSYAQNVEAINRLYADVVERSQTHDMAFARIDSLEDIARSIGNKEWEMESKLMRAYYFKRHFLAPNADLLKKMEDVVAESEKAKILHVQARAIREVAEIYWERVGNYELAFEQFLLLNRLLEGIPAEDFPDKTLYLYRTGEAFYYFKDYHKAIAVFKDAVRVPRSAFNAWPINSSYNTIGLSYQHLNQLDSAVLYFKKLYDNHEVKDYPLWQGIADGNIGYVEYLKGNHETAEPLLLSDVATALRYHDLGLAAGSGTALADIYVNRRDFVNARKFIDSCYVYIQQSGQSDRLRKLYPVMGKYYAAMGDSPKANAYIDSTIAAKDRYDEKFSALLLLRVEQKEQKRQQDQFLQEQERTAARRNLLILLLLLAAGALGIIYFISAKKNKIQRKLSNLRLQQTENELFQAKAQLDQFSKKILQNALIIETLQNGQTMQSNNHAGIEQLRQSAILTEDDWISFKKQFDRVHTGFTRRLETKYPALSQSEIRYLSLIKLELSHKEIAHALGVSPASLRVTWHRLRKKLDLSSDNSPEMLIRDIH